MIGVCPNCGETFSYNDYDSDYVHECNSGNESVDEEDVVVSGDYIDEATGDTVTKPKTEVVLQGIQDKNVPELTERGNRASTHRQRQHYEYVKLKRVK